MVTLASRAVPGLTGAALLVGVLLLLGPLAATAQTILNTERFQVEDQEGFHVDASVSFSFERGNSDVANLSASGIVGTVAGAHWPRLIFGGRYLSDEERSILDAQFLQARYSYLFSGSFRSFHFVQLQKNETLLLESRWLVGTGIRWTFHRSERTQLAFGTGAMGEWERLDPERLDPGETQRTETIRMANVAVASWEMEGGASLLNILYFQPDFGDFRDLRVLNDLALVVPISDHFNSSISLEWRRNTRPPGSLERDDLTLTAGFGVEFP